MKSIDEIVASTWMISLSKAFRGIDILSDVRCDAWRMTSVLKRPVLLGRADRSFGRLAARAESAERRSLDDGIRAKTQRSASGRVATRDGDTGISASVVIDVVFQIFR